MPDEDREKIMEKRSSMRSWRERGGKIPHRGELIGAALIAIIFLGLIASSYWGSAGGNSTSEQPKNTPAPAKTSTPVSPGSIPPPSIKINSPENITYNTSTPPLDFLVAGSNLDSVLLSVDDGPEIAIPNDGTIAKIDFARLNPLFIDDFSETTKGRWTESGNWRVEGGKYKTAGGTSSFGDPNWDDYIVEAKMKITSGRDVSIGSRYDGLSNYYLIQTIDAYGNFYLRKMDNKGYIDLANAALSGIDITDRHIWKIAANGSKIQLFIDGTPYIEYTDANNPYLKGKPLLRVVNANVEYDYIQAYKPLLDGTHELTIFANNTAGNSSTQTVYFTTNATTVETDEDTVGKIGLPVVKGGFEITVKSATPSNQYTSVWLSVKNVGDSDKTLKLGPGNTVIDNKGQQYESISVPKSAELPQTVLYPQAMREGGVYFSKVSDSSRKLQKLILYVNGEKLEFMLNVSKP